MSSATGLCGVAGERAAGPAELVVERDRCAERDEACGEANTEVVEGSGAVALEGEEVFEGPEDRLDALADGCEMRAAARLVFAARPHDPGFESLQVTLEVFAAEVLVADQDQHLAGQPLATSDHLQANDFLVDLWRGQRECPRRAVHREQGVQPETPEVAAVTGAVPVVSGVRERDAETRVAAAFDGLTRA